MSEYDYDYQVFPQCVQKVGPEGTGINELEGVPESVCTPDTLITKIVDIDIDS